MADASRVFQLNYSAVAAKTSALILRLPLNVGDQREIIVVQLDLSWRITRKRVQLGGDV